MKSKETMRSMDMPLEWLPLTASKIAPGNFIMARKMALPNDKNTMPAMNAHLCGKT